MAERASLPASDPEVRKTGFGASDAAPAMGLSRWQSPLELYLEKRGAYDGDEDPLGNSEAVRMGVLFEPLVLHNYAMTEGKMVLGRSILGRPCVYLPDGNVKRVTEDEAPLLGTLRHPEREWQFCHLDGLVVPDLEKLSEPTELVEAKSSLGRLAYGDDWGDEETDQVPAEYVAQGQHQMDVVEGVLGRAVPLTLPVILAGPRWRVYRLHPSTAFQAEMVDMESYLWFRIQRGFAPDPTPDDRGSKALEKIYPHASGEKRVVTATEPVHKVAHRLYAAKQRKKQIEEEIAGLQNTMKRVIGDDTGLIGPDWKANWSEIASTVGTDYEQAFNALLSHAGLVEADENVRAILADSAKVNKGYRRFNFYPGKELKRGEG